MRNALTVPAVVLRSFTGAVLVLATGITLSDFQCSKIRPYGVRTLAGGGNKGTDHSVTDRKCLNCFSAGAGKRPPQEMRSRRTSLLESAGCGAPLAGQRAGAVRRGGPSKRRIGEIEFAILEADLAVQHHFDGGALGQNGLWTAVLDGTLDIVASDHSPAPPEKKAGDFFRAWGGIAGVQSTLAVLLEGGHHARGLPLERIAALLSSKPAERFRIANKGAIALGYDADLTLVDLDRSHTLETKHLMQRHPMSPYLGYIFRGSVMRTIRRGETIFADGVITAKTPGKMIRPTPAPEN